ncbi:MAG: hypothetical protein QOI61_1271 [Actinomycetota bacterium]
MRGRKVVGLVGAVSLLSAGALVMDASPAKAAPPTTFAELRAAVDAANAAVTDQTITLPAGTTYTLTGSDCGSGTDEDANAVGDLDIAADKNVTLATPSGDPAAIEVNCASNAPSRAIEFGPGDTTLFRLTLRNIVISGGVAPRDEQGAGEGGGAVAVYAENLLLENATFSNNSALSGAPGVVGSDGTIGGFGGAVFITAGTEIVNGLPSYYGGALTVTGSTFEGNRAGDGGAGFDGLCPDSAAEATNAGPGGPGGAVAALLGPVSIDTSSFTNNASGDGGEGGDGAPGVESMCQAGAGGRGGAGGVGGALAVASNELSVSHSLFSGNTTGDGGDGGDAADGWDASTPGVGGNGNEGGDGGRGGVGAGVFNQRIPDAPTADRLISNSTFDANTSGDGGNGGDGGDGGTGIDAGTGVAGNGGAGGCGGSAGAVADTFATSENCAKPSNVIEGSFAMEYVTATDNGDGGAGGAGGTAGAGDTPGTAGITGDTVGGSLGVDDLEATALVVGTSGPGGSDCNGLAALYAVFSFSTDADCDFGVDSVHTFAEFNLVALADNGGPTLTRRPGTGSILINFVPSLDCGVPDDQRLLPRPIGSGCEVGAVEVQAQQPKPDCAVTGIVFQSTWVRQQQQQVKVVGKNPGTVQARCKVTLFARRIAPQNGPDAPKYPGSWTLTVIPGANFAKYFQVTPPVAGTYRVRACARAVNGSGAVIDGNAANDCKTANRVST